MRRVTLLFLLVTDRLPVQHSCPFFNTKLQRERTNYFYFSFSHCDWRIRPNGHRFCDGVDYYGDHGLVTINADFLYCCSYQSNRADQCDTCGVQKPSSYQLAVNSHYYDWFYAGAICWACLTVFFG